VYSACGTEIELSQPLDSEMCYIGGFCVKNKISLHIGGFCVKNKISLHIGGFCCQ